MLPSADTICMFISLNTSTKNLNTTWRTVLSSTSWQSGRNLSLLNTGVSETILKYFLKCKQTLTSLRLFPEILVINTGPFPLQTQLYGTTGLQNVTANVKSERFNFIKSEIQNQEFQGRRKHQFWILNAFMTKKYEYWSICNSVILSQSPSFTTSF